MLEGSDKEWIIGTGNQISLIYKDLPRGNYVFKLRVRKSNSGWSEPLEMAIRIRPTLVEYPLFWAAVTLVVAGIAFLISYRIRKQKMKQLEMDHELVMTQQKALQSMMNPHFVFNSLGSIQNYLLKNKGAEAVMYLTEFSRLIRQNLSSINMPMIPLNEELDRLKNYLELENKRLEKIFDYEIAVEKVLQTQQVFIPSMLIQPFAENAIWHGIATLQKDGMIRLKIEKHTSATLKITIEDNGIGITESRRNQGQRVQHLRMGMDMTMKRLDLLSRRYKTEASVTTADCNPGMPNPGTRVELVMPFLLSV
jgi:LytS/YehU family sensor histidine kinase